MRAHRNLLGLASIFTAVATLLGPASLCAGQITVQVPSLLPTTTSSVNFTVQDWGSVTGSDLQHLSPQTFQSDQQYFTVSVDTGSFSRDKVNRFQFDLYVQKTNDSSAEHFHVYEDPVGVFIDYIAPVEISVKSAGIVDSASLTDIPIHAQYEGDVFSRTGTGNPIPVELGISSQINIPIVSNLTNLQASINAVTVSSTTCTKCWQGQLTATYDSTVQPSGPSALILTVQPNTLFALYASAFAVDPHKAHDTLAVYVTSTPGQGGLPSLPQKIEIPVRFSPSFLYLASAVILGSLLGFGIRRLIPAAASDAAAGAAAVPATGRFPRWARDLLLSVATAVIVELFGLVLFNNTNTSVVVFGFSLDPSQVAPAFLVAILVAGGPPVVSRISEAIKV
ncbi:MAG: hypothetical protein WAK26_00270 [Terracidiphilus sp.]